MFIDASFVAVLLDRLDSHHEGACVAFDELIGEYERGVTLLYTHSGVVAEVGEHVGRCCGCVKSCACVGG